MSTSFVGSLSLKKAFFSGLSSSSATTTTTSSSSSSSSSSSPSAMIELLPTGGSSSMQNVAVFQHRAHIEQLPDELILRILEWLDSWKDLLRSGYTCSRWQRIAESDLLWRKFYLSKRRSYERFFLTRYRQQLEHEQAILNELSETNPRKVEDFVVEVVRKPLSEVKQCKEGFFGLQRREIAARDEEETELLIAKRSESLTNFIHISYFTLGLPLLCLSLTVFVLGMILKCEFEERGVGLEFNTSERAWWLYCAPLYVFAAVFAFFVCLFLVKMFRYDQDRNNLSQLKYPLLTIHSVMGTLFLHMAPNALILGADYGGGTLFLLGWALFLACGVCMIALFIMSMVWIYQAPNGSMASIMGGGQQGMHRRRRHPTDYMFMLIVAPFPLIIMLYMLLVSSTYVYPDVLPVITLFFPLYAMTVLMVVFFVAVVVALNLMGRSARFGSRRELVLTAAAIANAVLVFLLGVAFQTVASIAAVSDGDVVAPKWAWAMLFPLPLLCTLEIYLVYALYRITVLL